MLAGQGPTCHVLAFIIGETRPGESAVLLIFPDPLLDVLQLAR